MLNSMFSWLLCFFQANFILAVVLTLLIYSKLLTILRLTTTLNDFSFYTYNRIESKREASYKENENTVG